MGLPEGGHPDPFLVNEELDDVADEVMQAIEEAYLFYSTDIVSGQLRYCFPPLNTISGAFITPPTAYSAPYPAAVRKTEEFIVLFPNYLTVVASGPPVYIVTEGRSSLYPYPTPDFSNANGLTTHGIGQWDNAAWAAETATCPLPARQHMCLVHGLAARLAPLGSPQRAQEMGEFLYQKGKISQEMDDLVTSARSRSQGEGFRYPVGPLNL